LDTARFRQAAVISQRRADDSWAAEQPCPVERVDMRREISPAQDWRAYRHLLRLFRAARPALVHAHSSKAGFLARRAASCLGTPALYTPHVFAFQMPGPALRRRLFARLERLAARWCRFVICVSEAERQAALAWRVCPPEQLVVIRNGIDAERYCADLPGRAYRVALEVEPDDELLVAVGELRAQKNYPALLQAVAALRGRRSRLRCLIAGEGPERAALQTIIAREGLADCVRLLGDRDDVPALLSAADLFVMTSLYEGCPYSLLEAMAVGVPVVAVRAAGVDEIVGPETGRLAEPSELPQALAAALDAPEESAARARRAREMVAERFRLEDMLAQTAALYDRCLSRPST